MLIYQKEMLDLKHAAGQIYSVEVGFILFGHVVHQRKHDNLTLTLNGLKHARQSYMYFAFSSNLR